MTNTCIVPNAIEPRHLQEWRSSCVSDEIISRNVWSITDSREVDQLLNRNDKQRWKHSDELVPGWAVAGVNPKTGERTFKGAQFKPDKSPIDPKTNKPRKYLSPAKIALSPLFLEMEDTTFWAKLIIHVATPIILCEGAKKAGALLSIGYAAISLPGVSTGGKLGRLRPELELYCRYGRTVYIAFDRDILNKKPVQQALKNLGRMLKAKGCMVYVLEWDNRFKGIDDFIASGGDVQHRIDNAQTLEEWIDGNEDEGDRSDRETCKLAIRYERVADKLQGRLRWNALKGVPELDGVTADLDELRIYLALKYNIEVPSEDCKQILIHLAKRTSFSPVSEYLNHCAATYEADDDLLNSLAKTYLGTDSPLHACYIRKTLISAVARALSPGCKVDTVCILSGAQGCGKSTFWKTLAGEEQFDDSVGSVSDKDERLKLHQSWFVEWAELESVFKRKDVSTVKAFITTQTDQIRPPYGRDVKEFPRPSIIVGTTNFDEFLADPTGSRRFWVVPVRVPFIPLDELAAERDRIWAAAVHAFHAGESWILPPELRQQAVEENAEFQMSDPWEEPVFAYCDEREKVTASEILSNVLNMDIDRQDRASQMRVTNLLKAGGWATRREVVHGKRKRFWFNPKFLDKGCPSCPEKDENQTAVEGQPSGQPPGQPSGQPPDLPPQSLTKSEEGEFVDNLTNLDNQIPKSTRNLQNSLCTDEPPSNALDGKSCEQSSSINGKSCEQSSSINGMITTTLEPPPLAIGDRVEILQSGQFYGKHVLIEAIADGVAVVRGDEWVVTQRYQLEELRRLKRKGGQNNG